MTPNIEALIQRQLVLDHLNVCSTKIENGKQFFNIYKKMDFKTFVIVIFIESKLRLHILTSFEHTLDLSKLELGALATLIQDHTCFFLAHQHNIIQITCAYIRLNKENRLENSYEWIHIILQVTVFYMVFKTFAFFTQLNSGYILLFTQSVKKL